MPSGIYTTARGQVINMDELMDKANLPLIQKKQTKTTVKKRYDEPKPINVRGFQPQPGAAKTQDVPDDVAKAAAGNIRIDPAEQPIVTSTTESGKAETLADVTGLKVKPSDGAVERAKARAAIIPGGVPAEEVASKALNEILSDLEVSNPNAIAAADVEDAEGKPRSRSRKTAANSE